MNTPRDVISDRLARVIELRDKCNVEIVELRQRQERIAKLSGRPVGEPRMAEANLAAAIKAIPAARVREWARARDIDVPPVGQIKFAIREACFDDLSKG